MLVRFWGTRGSLPSPLDAGAVRRKLRQALQAAITHGLPPADSIDRFIDRHLEFDVAGTYGGNTACVELDEIGPDYVICDLGTGLREFGNAVMRRPRPGRSKTFNIFLSHLHWDHIMGFPFFVPAYVPGYSIVVHSCHAEAEAALRRQHGAPSFPVDFAQLGAAISFRKLEPDQDYTIAGMKVRAIRQHHEGDSYGYRFEHAGKVVVYSTDSEHKPKGEPSEETFAQFFRDADLVIFDAMYSLAEAVSLKEDWGHSSNILGVELAHRARAKQLALFHHEPSNDDAALLQILLETVRFEELSRDGPPLKVVSAYDGLEVRL